MILMIFIQLVVLVENPTLMQLKVKVKKKIYPRPAAISNKSDSPNNSDFDFLELDNEITNHYSKVPNKESNKLNNNLVHTGIKLYSTSPVSITKKGNDNMVNFAKDKVNTTNLDNVDKEKMVNSLFGWDYLRKLLYFLRKQIKMILITGSSLLICLLR